MLNFIENLIYHLWIIEITVEQALMIARNQGYKIKSATA